MITGSHGIRGCVKVKPFTEDPEAVTAYGPLSDADGRETYALTLLSRLKGQWLARLDGVDDRDAADRMKGRRLYADRDRLPAAGEDEFYYDDLVGLAAVALDGTPLGTVRGVFDFGAGDVLEIVRPGAADLLVAFTREAVPAVDLAAGRLVVDPPAETEVPAEAGADADADREAAP